MNTATVSHKSLEQDRLVALIEFAKESAKLRAKPASTVAQHGVFALWENDVQGRPGIALNLDRDEGADEVWLEVKRLHETKALEPKSAMLKPWVELTQGPDAEPKLRSTVEGAALITAGTHRSALQLPRKPEERDLPEIQPDQLLPLVGYDQEALVRSQLSAYVENLWRPWAEEEKRRRWTIRLYGQLFTLKQQLEGSIVESQLEMAWGCGLGIWTSKDGSISYPLVTATCRRTHPAADTATVCRPSLPVRHKASSARHRGWLVRAPPATAHPGRDQWSVP